MGLNTLLLMLSTMFAAAAAPAFEPRTYGAYLTARLQSLSIVGSEACGATAQPTEFFMLSKIMIPSGTEDLFKALLKDSSPVMRCMGLLGLSQRGGPENAEAIRPYLMDRGLITYMPGGCSVCIIPVGEFAPSLGEFEIIKAVGRIPRSGLQSELSHRLSGLQFTRCSEPAGRGLRAHSLYRRHLRPSPSATPRCVESHGRATLGRRIPLYFESHEGRSTNIQDSENSKRAAGCAAAIRVFEFCALDLFRISKFVLSSIHIRIRKAVDQ
jgi:hypothetical protein